MSFDFKGSSGQKKGGGSFSFGGSAAVPDPLADVEYSGDLGEDAGKELTALQQGFADRAKAERDRFRKATDSEFWFAVCFTSREEKEAFLKAARVRPQLMGDKYIDGRQLARMLGIEY